MDSPSHLRQLEKEWDWWTIAGAMIVSSLGTFTSTQLMIQARLSARFSTVFTWIVIISLTFGFCASWSLHFVGMLACKLDLPINLNIGLTLFSAVLAVTFTFLAIGTELLWQRYTNARMPDVKFGDPNATLEEPHIGYQDEDASMPLLGRDSLSDDGDGESPVHKAATVSHVRLSASQIANSHKRSPQMSNGIRDISNNEADEGNPGALDPLPAALSNGVETSETSDSSSHQHSSIKGPRLDNLKTMAYQRSVPTKNAFVATYEGVYAGMGWKAILMGLVWSLSLTCMHYGGLAAMQIPGGYLTLNIVLVVVSALISWTVCVIGYIYMVNIEPHLSQQVLFSVVAALGIAAMHFTGMRATTFWSQNPPADIRGYPAQLPIAVCSISILTCMLANGLLAQNAILSRNKLAEIVWTRRKLWRTIAQKENAEAAAASRTNFIASASHEIRTPLHHLQGYSDLLSRTELTEEGRQLLVSIQRATNTLSLITNNVLDWSKLESDSDTLCRLTSLDIRAVCESILVLLPNQDDQGGVEVLAVVAPNVPKHVLLDETYIHRILMNLLSNSLKFTRTGYVLLSLEMVGVDLVAKVRDSGSGIPTSFLPRLFEPFSQAQTRGTQRGTGLGLSIVKQLLSKMQGNITVKSQHAEDGFRIDETGTTVTITIPIQMAQPSPHQQAAETGTVAVFCPSLRVLEGLTIAWNLLGFDVVVVQNFGELSNLAAKYVWADSEFLQQHQDCLRQLLDQDTTTVLVPFEHQDSLQRLPGLLSASHFIPLQKPLLWHTFNSRIDIARHASIQIEASRAVNFASRVSVTEHEDKSQSLARSYIEKNVSILLVEDNPINQKLGKRMLSSLGYSVLIAEDGDDAIAQTLKYDMSVDMILMDQSMPIKDGATATREIRALEASGQLLRRHPIIAVTAVVDTESRALFKDAGADDFLPKPLSLGRLEQTLATFFRVD